MRQQPGRRLWTPGCTMSVEPRPCLQLLPHCVALRAAVLCSCLPCALGVFTAVVPPHQVVEPTAWHFAGGCRPAASDCKIDSLQINC